MRGAALATVAILDLIPRSRTPAQTPKIPGALREVEWHLSSTRFSMDVSDKTPTADQAFNFHPVRKIHHTTARHSARKPRIALALTTTLTSATP